MIIPPNEHALLDATFARASVQIHFSKQLAVLREANLWGANLLLRMFQREFKSAADAAGVGGMSRQALAMSDATLLCLESGAVGASFVTLRGLVEARIGLAWIMDRGIDRWGRQYYVSTIRHERQWARRRIRKSLEFVEYSAAYQRAYGSLPSISPEEEKAAISEIEQIDDLLSTEYAEISAWFDAWISKNCTKRGVPAREPDWYKPGPGAPTSFAAMSEQIGIKVEYLNAYRYASQYTHGSDAHAHIRRVDSDSDTAMTMIVPIRDLANFGLAMSMAVSNLVSIYTQLVERFRPGESLKTLLHLDRWLRESAVPNITIEPVHRPV